MTRMNVSAVFFALALAGCAAQPGEPETPEGALKPEPLLGATCNLDSQCEAGEECMRPVCITTPCDFPGSCQLKTNYQDPTLISIPDNDPRGITRTLEVPAHGRTVESLSVMVNIAHSYRGDLRVTLTSPSGTTRVLHDRTGGSARDLVIDLAGDTGFAGEPATGSWTLRVYDLAARDVGTLQLWRLVFGFGAADDPTVDAWARVNQVPTIESAHNYADNLSQVFDLSHAQGVPGSKRVRLHFSRLSTERNYDFVEILGAGDRVVQRLTGNLGEVTSNVIEGDQVKVRLRTDGSVRDWGFAIDSIEVFGHGCLDLDDCSEGYRCAVSRRLCAVYPCFFQCLPEDPEPAPTCHIAGCSGQVCSEDPGVITTCEVAPWHECLRLTTCDRQSDGACGWTPSTEYLACLASHGRGAAEGEACGDSQLCNDGLYCDLDGGSSVGVCRTHGSCEDVSDCSDEGNSWAHVLCVGSATCEAGRCGWRCGPEPVCREGETRNDGCNTCSCSGGLWRCTLRYCPPVAGIGETCGGIAAIQCAEFLTCDYGRISIPAGANACEVVADRGGVCVEARSPACTAGGGAVCGCNGQTFANDCARAGLMGWAYDGSCRFGQTIPDNSATGLTTSIAAVARSAGTTARVQVDIRHTYRGDLVVTVESPGGRVYTLTNRAGGSADDFHFDGTLDAGASAAGTWTLRVTDRAAIDVGTLDFFGVTPL